MKRLIFWLLMALGTLLCSDMAHAQQYIPVITSTSCIGDGSGTALASGTFTIVGTDQNDNPLPYRAGSNGQAITSPIVRTITNGQLATSLQLANPASSSPTGIYYRFTIQDFSSKRNTIYKGITLAANSGANFDFCLMNTGSFVPQVSVITNPGTINGNTVQNGDFTINARFITTMQTVAFAATQSFDCSSTSGGSFFKTTLTGNVTSSSLNNCSTGQRIILEICQDATGSRTFSPPSNIQNFVTIPSTASTCTAQFFIYDGNLGKAVPNTVSVTLTGDVTTSGSVATVIKVNGVTIPSGPATHSIPTVTAANTITYKVLPDCQAPLRLQYTQSTDTWSCTTPGVVPNKQFFTSNGTFTIPSGVTSLEVYVTGGGGAGGGATTTANASGTGGGGGGTAIKWLTGLTPGNTLTVTIGGGGTGAANASGGNGANTTLASGTQTITTLTGNGGLGGAATGSAVGGIGGAASNGDINLTGGQPDSLRSNNMGSVGGLTYWGNGGVPGFLGAGAAGSNCGTGGGGAGGGAGGAVAGGNGAGGCVLIKWYTVQ